MTQEAKIAVLNSKMDRARAQFDANNGYGPTLVTVIGFICLLGLIGIPLIIFGAIWAHCNQKAREAAEETIKECEKELLNM